MKPEQQKELWQLRFMKILELEQASFGFYEKLLKEKSELLEETEMKPLLKKIMQEEAQHIRIARNLVRLAR